MAAPKKWTVRDGGIVTVYDTYDKPITVLSLMKGFNIETQSETVYSSGGRGNGRITSHSGNKTSTFEMQTQVFDFDTYGLFTGGTSATGKCNIRKYAVLTVASNKVTLPYTPISGDGALLGCQVINPATGETISEVTGSLSGSTVTFSSGVQEGDTVRVFYITETGVDAHHAAIYADKTTETVTIVVDAQVTSICDGKLYDAQLIVHRARPNDQFALALSNEGDPSTFTFAGEILVPACADKIMYELIVYDSSTLTSSGT